MTSHSTSSQNSPDNENEYSWNTASIFDSTASWETEIQSIANELQSLDEYAGRLGEKPEFLTDFLVLNDAISARAERLHLFAMLQHYKNTIDSEAGQRLDRAQQLLSDLDESTAFLSPELLALPEGTLARFVTLYPKLGAFEFFLTEVERFRPHTRSREVEEILASVSLVQDSPESIYTALSDSDLNFGTVKVGISEVALAHGNVDALLAHPDRSVRKQTYESYADGYLAHKSTFGQILISQAKSSMVFAKAGYFESTLTSALFDEALPENVFNSVLEVCNEYRSLFHRYFRARAKGLGLEKIAEYDLLAPLSPDAPSIPYEVGRRLVLESLSVLGDEYVAAATSGLTVERWADVYPTSSKYSNPFSATAYGTYPFLLLNYSNSMPEVGTLAHELGHSMHSRYANTKQPYCYSSYSSMVAETASNLNQVLLRSHVLHNANRDTALAMLDEAFYYCHRYLFLMPTLSEIEHKVHSTYAEGGAMSSDELIEATRAAFIEAYGDSVELDLNRVGIRWAQLSHFYQPYYFFQYAVGISAAMSVGKRILDREDGILEKYFEFLSAGGSKHTVDIFKIIDIDIGSPEVYQNAFRVMEGYVTMLEKLVQ